MSHQGVDEKRLEETLAIIKKKYIVLSGKGGGGMSTTINHDEQRKRFFCEIDGKECSVDYELKETEPKTIDIYRTFVHIDLRGKGIAENLLKTIIEFAIKNGFVIQPSCSYAVMYFKRRPENAVVLAKGVDLENGGSCRVP